MDAIIAGGETTSKSNAPRSEIGKNTIAINFKTLILFTSFLPQTRQRRYSTINYFLYIMTTEPYLIASALHFCYCF